MGKSRFKALKKGGTFLLVEFHPLIDLLDIETQYGYFFDKHTKIEKQQEAIPMEAKKYKPNTTGGAILSRKYSKGWNLTD